MEKVGLKSAFILVLCGILGVAAFGAEVTLIFDPNGGTGTFPDQTVESGKTLDKEFPKEPPVKEGHNFMGWFDDKDAVFKETTPVRQAVTVTAKWEPKEFTVTFELDGGAMPSPNEVKVTYNEYVEIPPPPERNDHKFLGWFVETDAGEEPCAGKIRVTKDKTVFAKWMPFSEMLDNVTSGSDDIKSEIATIKKSLFFIAAGAGGAALFLIALAALNLVLIKKTRKRVFADIQEKFDGLAQNQNGAEKNIIEKISLIPSLFESILPAQEQDTAQIERLQSAIARLDNEKSAYCNRINSLERENQILKEEKRVASGIANGSLNPVSVFNNWAASPFTQLPKSFYYIEGDLRIRVAHELTESQNTDSKWITNRDGVKKYLFPNPNSFNQMTNIDELYKMDMSKLKAKGQNRVKIIKPCNMTNNGFVEFPGELEIL
jgi:uncharacterized repeat protein (TIGR02543 family)